MALFNIGNWDLKDDPKHFKELYEKTKDNFMVATLMSLPERRAYGKEITI